MLPKLQEMYDGVAAVEMILFLETLQKFKTSKKSIIIYYRSETSNKFLSFLEL